MHTRKPQCAGLSHGVLQSFLGCILETDSADVSWKQYSHAKALLELDNQNLLHTCLTRREVEVTGHIIDAHTSVHSSSHLSAMHLPGTTSQSIAQRRSIIPLCE